MKMNLNDFGLGAVCQSCGGSGKAVNHSDAGKWVKGYRQRASKTLQQVGDLIGLSAQYLSDLEHGRRAWNAELFDRVVKSIDDSRQRAKE